MRTVTLPLGCASLASLARGLQQVAPSNCDCCEHRMTASNRKGGAEQNRNGTPAANDPVLAALSRAEERYREMLMALDEQRATLERELARASHDNEALSALLAVRDRELEDVRRRVDHQRETSGALAAALNEIHRTLVGGSNVYELILKACLTLTGATRGVYATVDGEDRPPRIRAAVDVSDSHWGEITNLCRATVENGRVVACNDLPPVHDHAPGSEAFRNCLAAPVVLRNHPAGVVVVADKATGDFSEDDAGVLLSVGNHAAVAIENARLQHQVQEAYLSIVSVLAQTMATRSQLDGHIEDEACRLATAAAERLDLSEYQCSSVYYAALLHDIGFVGVSDGVLNKPGSLSDAERELIRSHAQIGHDLLREVPILESVAGIVRLHHERYDGQGYPEGLKGDAIPIEARIVAVVDAYGAMLAPRSFRPALTADEACLQLREGAGTQFDPQVVDAFLAALEASRGASMRLEASGVALPGLELQHTT
jgi:hypothetical protein